MIRFIFLTLYLFSLFAAPLAQATTVPQRLWNIRVQGKDGRLRPVRGIVFDLGHRHRATIFAVGPYEKPTADFPAYSQLSGVIGRTAKSAPDSIVFNGGFSEDGLYKPAGLLLVNRIVAHPISLAQKSNGD